MTDKPSIGYVGGPVGAVSSHGEAGVGEVLKPAANPNKAELRRLAEAAYPGPWYVENGIDQVRDNVDEFVCETGEDEPVNAAYIAAANPAAVLSLLDECDKAEAERDAALAELEALRIQVSTLTEWYSNALDVISEVTAAIPGVTYMDPPDGGDVSIPEQIRRMAKDAERYRWLREQEAESGIAVLCVGSWEKAATCIATTYPVSDELDTAIDAAMSQEVGHV